ncbi:hypothetical protein ACFQ3N_00680 [Virgibacillus byunsanensis]|uniref:Uncharacterized protein n=1 Tax=Virgibacillus byunsanensis TaxID=570945 RepID=A0ABW3LFY5_9BACI
MDNYVNQILYYWEGKPLEGAKTIIQKYGYPHEATMSRLIWYNNGPWKRTIIHRDTVPHNFPTPHLDFLEQTIDYRVPVNLFDDVAAFDGSVYLDRTKGEASATCHKEAMNLLSLNLLSDIVTGKLDVQGAKMFYAQTAYMFSEYNISSPYTEGLLFPKQFNTADPGIIYFK